MSSVRKVQMVLGAEILGSAWVRRLKRISFLGAVDLQPDVRLRYTRFDHSLAVASMGVGIAASAHLGPRATKTFVAACLLHDVGHFPLSHSAESGFAAALGIDHHGVTRSIVLGDGAISHERSLAGALRRAGVDPDGVWNIIDGVAAPAVPKGVALTLSGRINIDTFDGITRVGKMFGLRTPRVGPEVFRVGRGTAFLRPESVGAVDAFWELKHAVYARIINRPSNIMVEAALSRCAERATRDLFRYYERFDDSEFASWWAGTRLDLRGVAEGCRLVDGDGEYSREVKEYTVEPSVRPGVRGLSSRVWPARYVHRRRRVHLEREVVASRRQMGEGVS